MKETSFADFRVDPDSLPSGFDLLGSGSVGGKSIGLLYSKSAIEKLGEVICDHQDRLRIPRSWILATSVFDDFIELNNVSDMVQMKCDDEIDVPEMNRAIIAGQMPKDCLEFIGSVLREEKRPLAVRSSSFLEDSLKHSFAGVYQSVFIPNDGTMAERIAQLETAIKIVYVSTFGDDAKEYRKKHKISWQDERMGVLIQSLVGSHYTDGLYYPLFAGVAFSRNYYPWTDRIRSEDGVGRLVLGLGTRAVGRYYARVFSPTLPSLRPEGMVVGDIVKYSQEIADVLDFRSGLLIEEQISNLKEANNRLHMICSALSPEGYITEASVLPGKDARLLATFDAILGSNKHMPFIPLMKSLLTNLERRFGMPVDIEFAVNFEPDENGEEKGMFYLLQVRPLGGRPEHRRIRIPKDVPQERVIFRAEKILGNGVQRGLKHIVFIPHETYEFQKGFTLAREIGSVNKTLEDKNYILIGPGRWATQNPELGIPVRYAEISNASVIVEVSYKRFSPELSYGTHFFGDMLATNTLYIPLWLEKGGYLNERILKESKNRWDSENVRLVEIPEGVDVYADGESHTAIAVMR
ncbi:MAG: PEP/pyruvate-binding domain-containing protein [Candidatus Thermoplasmatota archaeon]|nr:PEP/pyruvate-binding domain-containing protein [Candidatus Thermoplasmatota archaeon]